MKATSIRRYFALASSSVALATLVACGGGGGGGLAGSPASFNGTVAKGAPLVGATMTISCANGAVFTATTNAQGAFSTASQNVTYPCTAIATLGSLSLRSIGFGGTTINATPLTDLLVSTVLAAASPGGAALTLDQFKAKIATDATFAASVSKAETVAQYRAAVVAVVREQLIVSGKTPAQADAALAAAATAGFESAPFAIGSPLDTVLDVTAAVIQNTDGSVKLDITTKVLAAGDALPTPVSKATGS